MSDPNVHFDLVNKTEIRLNIDQKEFLDKDLELKEIFEAATEMEKNKVCGCDGLSLEFYIHFWHLLKNELWSMYLESKQRGSFVHSARKGIISLLPKKDKDPRILRNLRPLAILNYDYKILAKALANRLKMVLPFLIGEQQTGFMAGRQIQSNIKQTMDIVTHVSKNQKRAVIVSIDFEKCFDRIEHRSIYEAMRYFNIGEEFISWIHVFFTNALLCTFNAGRASDFFVKGRGVNQGCPISPFCYNLCGELLAHLIKNNPLIKGIRVNDNLKNEVEHVISQFADDTALFLTFSEECICAAIDTLSRIEHNTGLKVSYEKTTVYRIGSLKNSNAKIYTTKELNWSDDDIPMLGVVIQNRIQQSNESFHQTINKMESVANMWYNRSLTLLGKILLINTLMSSLFVYKMSVLPLMSKTQLNNIDTIINKFIWKGRKPKIPTKQLQNSIDTGGVKLANFQKRHIAAHLQWIKCIKQNPNFQYVYHCLLPGMDEMNWKVNIAQKDVKKLCNCDCSWSDILSEWATFHCSEPQSKTEIENQIIWYNSFIRVNKYPVKMNVKIFKAGIITMKDILGDSGRLLTFQDLVSKYGRQIENEWLWYEGFLKAIPHLWKVTLINHADVVIYSDQLNYDVLIHKKRCSAYIYEILINQQIHDYCKYGAKFYDIINEEFSETEYRMLFKNIYKTTGNIKLRNFQYRLLLNKIFTNSILCKWKIVSSAKCDYCECDKQNISHLLWYCPNAQNIWKEIKNKLNKLENLNWTLSAVMKNMVHESLRHGCNQIVSAIKYCIFQNKCMGKKANIKTTTVFVTNLYKAEEYVAKITNANKCFEKRWNPVLCTLPFT